MSVFYQKNVNSDVIQLSEDESRHCSQVLRHQVGDEIRVFDGKGHKYRCVLTTVSKKNCVAQIEHTHTSPGRGYYFHLAIAPTKNIDRMEWMMEKLCEIGIDELTLLEAQHSERKKIRLDRLEKKAISAMKQSGNAFLPIINEITPVNKFLAKTTTGSKFIAHVDSDHEYLGRLIKKKEHVTLLIGPEGDFSPQEVEAAISAGYQAVSLGDHTLRTETAGLKACCFLSIINQG